MTTMAAYMAWARFMGEANRDRSSPHLESVGSTHGGRAFLQAAIVVLSHNHRLCNRTSLEREES